EDEVPFEVVARGSEGLGSSGNDDHIGARDRLLLQELLHRRPDAVIETAEDGGVSHVRLGGRVEMEDLAHGILVLILACSVGTAALPGGEEARTPVPSPSLSDVVA